MQASRVLRMSSIQNQALLIQPRTTPDVYLAAATTAWRTLTSPDVGATYEERVKKGIINPSVLKQSRYSGAMSLALTYELDEPLFQKYKFDAKQFIEGVKPALERYHDIQGQFQNTVFDHAEEDGTFAMPKENESSNNIVETIDDYLSKLKRLQDRTENFARKQQEDKESLAGQLTRMITPYMFKGMQEAVNAYILNETKLRYEAGSGEVLNVALLSARAVEMDQQANDLEETNEENVQQDELKNDPSAAQKEEESNFNSVSTEKSTLNATEDKEEKSQETSPNDIKTSQEEEEENNEPMIAAQVEVLYDINQTYQIPAADKDSQPDSESVESETKDYTVVCVAVFEGYLSGDPEGNENVQWKLAMTRPPEEFPYFLTAPIQ
mmetsp:Transcript_14/g.18  ORF Transcript_14/g.18 Transcript_14/m.18 type:complete len:382 (-) Transcript_14:596-1741(-)